MWTTGGGAVVERDGSEVSRDNDDGDGGCEVPVQSRG